MSQEARKAVQQWLAELGIRNPAELDVNEYQHVRNLLSSRERPGFGIFFSMLMFERQQAVAQLMNADLSNSAGAVKAAKLQGIVQCVDNVRDLVLNIADPIGEGSDSEPREVAGVRFDERRTEQQPVG